MKIAFVARGEFFVTKGGWKKLDGWMAIESSTERMSQRVFLGLRPKAPVPAAWTKSLLPLK